MRRSLFAWPLLAIATGCVGSTGSDLVTFDAVAVGAPDASGERSTFTSGKGFDVELTTATLHVGAIYLNKAFPTSGAQETSCTLPGQYVAEVTAGLDVDLLNAAQQPFSVRGEGTADLAIAGEVWLNGGAVDATEDTTPILVVEGTATRAGASFPFAARLTIGSNRQRSPTDAAMPGSNPICKQRIVSPIETHVTASNSGRLVLHVDVARMFANVDFSELTKGPDGVYRFADADADAPSRNLYDNGLRARTVYRFSWEGP